MAKNELQPTFLNLEAFATSELHCPDCNVPMAQYTCQNIIVDKCNSCDGIWFDHTKFGVFKRALDSFDLSIIKKIYHPPEPYGYYVSGCPRCHCALYDLNYSYNSGVKIKKCDECRGLWLPLHETLNLVALAKLSQDLAPDIRAWTKEIKRHQEFLDLARSLRRLGEGLGRRR